LAGGVAFALSLLAPRAFAAEGEGEPPEKAPEQAPGAEEAGAPAAESPPSTNSYELGAMSVFGSGGEVARVAGSAHVIDEEELEAFEDDDPHRALVRVPGV